MTQESPAVTIVATPAAPSTGQSVQFRVADPPPGPASYRWSFPGSGARPVNTGGVPSATAVFKRAGERLVGVRIQRGAHTLHGTLAIVVRRSAARTRTERRREPGHEAGAMPNAARPRSPGQVAQARTRAVPRASRGADPVVTIADFSFSPGTITIHVGDTVTWTNNGPSAHTATSQDGGFDTGVLQKGSSASHTFTRAGTFSYICQIHPFMHGRIVVLAATQSNVPKSSAPPSAGHANPGSAPSAGASAPTGHPVATSNTPTTQTGQPSRGTLPFTGLNLLWTVLWGIGLITAGAALRRSMRRRRG